LIKEIQKESLDNVNFGRAEKMRIIEEKQKIKKEMEAEGIDKG